MDKENLDLKNLKEKLKKFSTERDWEQYHSPKNLAMALSVEVAELVEIFQWSNDGGLKEIKDPETRKQIEDEIADIFIYLVRIANKMGIDIEDAVYKKLELNRLKYPVEENQGVVNKI